jgi:hypothetical protein
MMDKAAKAVGPQVRIRKRSTTITVRGWVHPELILTFKVYLGILNKKSRQEDQMIIHQRNEL